MSKPVFKLILVAVPVVIVAIPVFRAIPATLLWTFGASAVFALTYAVAVVVVLGFTPTDVMIIRSIEDKFGISLGPFDKVVRRFS